MTKQEKIQEAWGELWDDLPERQKECALKYNGWVSYLEYSLGYSPKDSDLSKKLYSLSRIKDSQIINDQFQYRPKSLSGIENNNGWIKIESENDLNKISGLFFVRNRISGNILIQEIRGLSKFNRESSCKKYSHYQPIEKPKPPIY